MNKTFRNLAILAIILMSTSLLTHCESTEENDIAEAQKCLNGVPDSAPYQAAQACESKIAGIFTPESYVLRCSIDFRVAGITSSGLLSAFQAAQGSGGSTAALIGLLTQNDAGTATPDLYVAEATYADCLQSGVASLIFIAGLSETGTAMTAAAGSTDPATFVATCQSTPSVCSPAVVGSTAQTIADAYCQGDNSSSQQCILLNSAIAAGNGDPTTIGQNIFNLLN